MKEWMAWLIFVLAVLGLVLIFQSAPPPSVPTPTPTPTPQGYYQFLKVPKGQRFFVICEGDGTIQNLSIDGLGKTEVGECK